MKRIIVGISWFPGLPSIWSKIEDKVASIEFARLSDYGSIVSKEWSFHFRFKDSFSRGKSDSLNISKPNEVRNSFRRIEGFVIEHMPSIISVHIGHSCEQIEKVGSDNHDVALGKVLSREDVIERILSSLKYLTEATKTPIAVEILDYHPSGAYEHVCSPGFIKEIFEKTPKSYLLLDIAHAEISASNLLKRDTDISNATIEYLKKLPLSRVIEIHLNAPGGNLDMHDPVTSREIGILKAIMPELVNLRVINLECAKGDIDGQIKEMLKLIE